MGRGVAKRLGGHHSSLRSRIESSGTLGALRLARNRQSGLREGIRRGDTWGIQRLEQLELAAPVNHSAAWASEGEDGHGKEAQESHHC